MIIAVDRVIPFWREAFSEIGEVRPFSAENLKPEDIHDADALIVRTVTRVDAALLEGSSIRFVAAASAGIDHIDRKFLDARGVGFGYAAGCNAETVAEYIVTALHLLASRRNWNLKNKSIAVIGVGQVGSRVAKKAQVLGMKVLLCDPPLRESTGDPKYRDFEDVLEADILTFHVPLVRGGPYPTWHMINSDTLGRLSARQYLINTSRGAVFDNLELKSAIGSGRIEGATLDVWEGEPRIDFSLLDLADIGTPHIAGIALDGKIRATEMVRKELCTFFNVRSTWNAEGFYPETKPIRPSTESCGQKAVLSALLQAFDIVGADAGLREIKSASAKAADDFTRLRDGYPLRPEFRHFRIESGKKCRELADIYTGIGFEVC